MTLLMLMGCLDHVRETLDVTVNVARRTATVDAVYGDVSPDVEELATLSTDETVAKLKEERDGVLARFAGGEAVSVRYVLHDAMLDLVVHAEGSFAFWAEDRGEPLRSARVLAANEWGKAVAGKPLFALWFESNARHRLSLTGTGPFEVVELAGDKPGETFDIVTFRRGKGTIHAESAMLDDQGVPVKGTGWVAGKPGLAAALGAAGLL